jgi:CO/xanthine dehydrogenase FAD-binding subunit
VIKEYFRPVNVPEALALLERKDIKAVPLGGGNGLDKWGNEDIAVVDIQNLGWNKIKESETNWEIGAMVTLQDLIEFGKLPSDFNEACRRETTLNIRNMATIGGTIAKKHNPSPLTIALLAMDVRMIWEPGGELISLSDWLILREKNAGRKLIKSIVMNKGIKFGFSCIGRSPQDMPVLMIGLACLDSKRFRLVIGGSHFDTSVVVDGAIDSGVEKAVSTYLADKGDETVSGSFLKSAGETLTTRLIEKIMAEGKE